MNRKNIKLNIEKNTHSKNGSSLIFVVFFLVMFLAFAAFAVDGTIVLTNRAELQNATEIAALAAASGFDTDPDSAKEAENVRTAATNTFKLLSQFSLKHADITAVPDTSSNKVTVNTTMISQPFFLAFLGISGIRLDAKAIAMKDELHVTSSYAPNIIWVTPSAAYLSDILSKNLNMNDTAIVTPLGNGPSASYYSIDGAQTDTPKFVNMDAQGGGYLSLGPGGFITIKLPAPIIDKPGPDLEIDEVGVLEGYMVFAGVDTDPTQPYTNKDNVGEDISWVNISASGTSLGTSSTLDDTRSHETANTKLTNNIQDKFYGSGQFDIASSKLKTPLSIVKYIRIVDDNREIGFVNNNGKDGNYYKTMLYGEASTATAGADIDAVTVLNHVKLTH